MLHAAYWSYLSVVLGKYNNCSLVMCIYKFHALFMIEDIRLNAMIRYYKKRTSYINILEIYLSS